MELLLLMKANFRKKKGVFISIIILAFIVSISFISMINVNKNISNRANEALNINYKLTFIIIIRIF